MMKRLITCIALALAMVGCASVGPSQSTAATTVAISDQGWDTFVNPLFQKLALKRARFVAPWNVALKRRDRNYFDTYLDVARQNGVEVLVSFSRAGGSKCPRRPCKLPSTSSYRKAFRAFRRRWPEVRLISPWNEANHRSQPTFRNPRRAAAYYNVVRSNCRGCTIVAADVIDERNMVSWLRVFKRSARRPRLWGLHNYKDTNPRRGQIFGGTKLLLRTVRGRVWLTETGGIVYFRLPNHKVLFPKNEARANRALGRMFRLARRYRSRVKRLYIYHWKQPPRKSRSPFDAGLIRSNGDPRPGYRTVRRYLGTRSFNP
jgi:hypothetical protein